MKPAAETTYRALDAALSWLAAHAGFPGQRLPSNEEQLILLFFAAAEEERRLTSARTGKHFGTPGGPVTQAQLNNYVIQRSRAHFKCDNSAKV